MRRRAALERGAPRGRRRQARALAPSRPRRPALTRATRVPALTRTHARASRLRDELLAMRAEFRGSKGKVAKPGLFGLPFLKNPLREAADKVGVEWKD